MGHCSQIGSVQDSRSERRWTDYRWSQGNDLHNLSLSLPSMKININKTSQGLASSMQGQCDCVTVCSIGLWQWRPEFPMG